MLSIKLMLVMWMSLFQGVPDGFISLTRIDKEIIQVDLSYDPNKMDEIQILEALEDFVEARHKKLQTKKL